MKEEIQIVIEIPFNTYHLTDKRLSISWLERRVDLFYHYTLKSLKAQSDQNFQAFIQVDPSSEGIIKELLAAREKLPPHIQFGTPATYTQYLDEWLKDKEVLYRVRLDSDDLYERTFIQRLRTFPRQKETQAIINNTGYLYNILSGKLTVYHHPSPPFYTLVHTVTAYKKGERYNELGTHKNVIKQLKWDLLPGRNFIITLSEENTSSGEWIRGIRRPYNDEEKQVVLKRFGISKERG